jgi:hypothetical protein
MSIIHMVSGLRTSPMSYSTKKQAENARVQPIFNKWPFYQQQWILFRLCEFEVEEMLGTI